MNELEKKASELFSRMLSSCNVSYSVEKTNEYNGDNRHHISLKSNNGEYSSVWFAKDNDSVFRSLKLDRLYVKINDGDDIERLPKIILDYISFYNFSRIMATEKNTNNDVCIFKIPSFKSMSELQIKLDLQIGMGEQQ